MPGSAKGCSGHSCKFHPRLLASPELLHEAKLEARRQKGFHAILLGALPPHDGCAGTFVKRSSTEVLPIRIVAGLRLRGAPWTQNGGNLQVDSAGSSCELSMEGTSTTMVATHAVLWSGCLCIEAIEQESAGLLAGTPRSDSPTSVLWMIVCFDRARQLAVLPAAKDLASHAGSCGKFIAPSCSEHAALCRQQQQQLPQVPNPSAKRRQQFAQLRAQLQALFQVKLALLRVAGGLKWMRWFSPSSRACASLGLSLGQGLCELRC